MSIDVGAALEQLPTWIVWFIGLYVAFLVLEAAKKAYDSWAPVFRDPEQRRLIQRRREFADFIEGSLRQLNRQEQWSEHRYAELEAEVEAEGQWRLRTPIPFVTITREGLRREKTLSKALERSKERLILLEGDPGSGKSVALKYLAQQMAKRGISLMTTKTIIPIYVNLKELTHTDNEKIDHNLIHQFIINSLSRANNYRVEEFLKDHFEEGCKNGTWLFLFDSFDEIPEVLSSTDADNIITQYASAVENFLHGMMMCRGVVASRAFRGPDKAGWTKFKILELSDVRRRELIRNADVGAYLEKQIIGDLSLAPFEVRQMASNPLFLNLLCEHLKRGNPFPENTHSVFETYISQRMQRDEERLMKRFNLTGLEMRSVAEQIAFCMAHDQNIGLNPSRVDISRAMENLDFTVTSNFETILDALEFIKLGRSEMDTDQKTFTFVHRRFQEYFATCIVLRNPNRVAVDSLIFDGRWRETTVTLCQTQPIRTLEPVIMRIQSFLKDTVDTMQIDTTRTKNLPEVSDRQAIRDWLSKTMTSKGVPCKIVWPEKLLYVLNLVQTSFGNRLTEIPNEIRNLISLLCIHSLEKGSFVDKKWILEVSGAAQSSAFSLLLTDTFSTGPQVSQDIAYKQASFLGEQLGALEKEIKKKLFTMWYTGELWADRFTTRAHVLRLHNSSAFLAIVNLLTSINPIDLVLHALVSLCILTGGIMNGANMYDLLLWVFFWFLLSYGTVNLAIFVLSSSPSSIFVLLSIYLSIIGKTSSIFALVAIEQTRTTSTAALIALIVVLIYTVIWRPSAIFLLYYHVITGRLGFIMHSKYWPLFPFILLIEILKVILLSPFRLKTLTTIVRVFVLFGTFAGSLFLLTSLIPSQFRTTMSMAFLLSAMLFFSYLFMRSTILFLVDMHRYLSLKPQEQRVTLLNFLDQAADFSHPMMMSRYMKAVRQKGLILELNSPESKSEAKRICEIFEEMTIDIDRGNRLRFINETIKKHRSPINLQAILGIGPTYREWINSYGITNEVIELMKRERIELERINTKHDLSKWMAKLRKKHRHLLEDQSSFLMSEIVLLLEQARTKESSI